MKLLLCILLASALAGCSTCATKQVEETKPDGSKTVTTTVQIRTFFDAHSDLAKLRTTLTDKTQGVSLAGLNQESSGSNVVTLTESVVGAAVGAAVRAAKP